MRLSIEVAADRASTMMGGRKLARGRNTRTTAALLAGLIAVLMPVRALAQTPYVQDEWKYGRRQDGATLHYCVDERDPDLPVARKMGQAIAGALLLEPKEHAVGEDWSGEEIDQVYQVLLETCDVFLGFKLIADAYPDWLTITRGYYRGSYVFVTADASWKSLADVPRSRVIGGTIGTSADIRLMQYLTALKPAERWSHYPVASDEAALRDVVAGKLAAALVWGPSFWGLQKADAAFAKLQIIAPKPLPASSVDVGAVMLARETFLRANLDQAIAALTADGTIESILKGFDFPATPVR
jgi:polar amino acid transport system substrate-binding protein